MGQKPVNRTAAERIPGAGGLNGLYLESLSLHPYILVICTASILSHGQEDKGNVVFVLKIADSFIVIFLA